MKNTHSILLSCFEKEMPRLKGPFFQYYNTCHFCIHKLLPFLPFSLRGGVRRVFVKHNILYFELINPALKTEFHYKLNEIKGLLKLIAQSSENCRHVTNWDIKSYYRDCITLTPPPPPWDVRYSEKGKGEFSNHAKHPLLYSFFEELRNLVKNPK